MTLLPIIKRQSIHEQVIEHLQDYILTNALRPGDRLPTETELARSFRVSRHSVRAAVKVLESVGVVETRAGDGSRLRQTNVRSLTEHLRFLFALDGATFEEMAATRSVIECAFLPVIVQHAEAVDFGRMEAAIASMRASANNLGAWIEADMEFHLALAAATKNRVMAGFGVMLQEFFTQMCADLGHLTPDEQQISIESHEQICQALRAKDVETAQKVMQKHLSVY